MEDDPLAPSGAGELPPKRGNEKGAITLMPCFASSDTMAIEPTSAAFGDAPAPWLARCPTPSRIAASLYRDRPT